MLEMNIGDNLVFDLEFEYQGTYYTLAKIRTSIGKRTAGIFDELVYKEHSLIVPKTPSWEPFSKRVLMEITTKLQRGETYDIEVKLRNAPGAELWKLDNAIHIIEVVPEVEFRNLVVTIKKG